MVEFHVRNPIFQGQLIEKYRPITFIVWKLRRVEKNAKKGLNNCKKYFFVSNKYQSVKQIFTLCLKKKFFKFLFIKSRKFTVTVSQMRVLGQIN